MAYSIDSLKKLAERQSELISAIVADGVDKYHVRIMAKNSKVPCPNFGTCPVRNCVNCSSCIHDCYVIKSSLRFPWAPWDTYVDADGKARRKHGAMWAQCVNAAIYENDCRRFWDEIETAFKRMRGGYMRAWESGDNLWVYDIERQDAMVKSASGKRLWSYTKTWEAVNEYMSANGGKLAEGHEIMFSVPFGMDLESFNAAHNPYNRPVFYVAPTAAAVKAAAEKYGMHVCPGNCQKCIDAGRGCPFGESSVCKAH